MGTEGEMTEITTVCGARLGDLSQVIRVEHQGKIYFLCDEVCRQAYELDPVGFLAEHRDRCN